MKFKAILSMAFLFLVGAAVAVLVTPEAESQSRTKRVTGPEMTIDLTSLPHTGGDCEMKGHNPHISIDARVTQQHSRLVITGTVDIVEDRPDHTRFSRSFKEVISIDQLNYPGYHFTGVDYSTGALEADSGDDNHGWSTYYGDGVIDRARCLTDTDGNDCGRVGCKLWLGPNTAYLERD